jgi:TusA-related sulfurtransferase
MLIKAKCHIDEIEIGDFLEVKIETRNSGTTIKKLTIKLDSQLLSIMEVHDMKREFDEIKKIIKEKKLKESNVIDLSIFT